MNAKQKLHQANLAKQTALFHKQASSELTVKNWYDQNNISIPKNNYWKRMVKEIYVNSVLPDIVPISPLSLPSLPSVPPDSQQAGLRELHDIRIEIGSTTLNEIHCL